MALVDRQGRPLPAWMQETPTGAPQQAYEDQYLTTADPNVEAQFDNWAFNTYGFARNGKEVKAGYMPFDSQSYRAARKQFAYLKKIGDLNLNFGDHAYDPWAADDVTNRVYSDFVATNKRKPNDVELRAFKAQKGNVDLFGDIDQDEILTKVADLMYAKDPTTGLDVSYDVKDKALKDELARWEWLLAQNPNNGQAAYNREKLVKIIADFERPRKEQVGKAGRQTIEDAISDVLKPYTYVPPISTELTNPALYAGQRLNPLANLPPNPYPLPANPYNPYK